MCGCVFDRRVTKECGEERWRWELLFRDALHTDYAKEDCDVFIRAHASGNHMAAVHWFWFVVVRFTFWEQNDDSLCLVVRQFLPEKEIHA